MAWLQLRFDTDKQTVERLEDALLETGSVAVTMQDNADEPVLEPGVGEMPLWGEVRLTGLYPADTDMQAVLEAMDPALIAGTGHRVEILEDKDWEREWMQHYRPMQFGQRLWICPSWLEPPQPDAVNLLLDPGLAFGTGTHPTTAMCLAQLDGTAPTGQQVVDYGCGSGILAVAALKLGAVGALGVDNDPQALLATRDNAQRNGIDDALVPTALPGAYDEAAYREQADLVIANILAGPLRSLSGTLIDLLKPGGSLMLAGLLDTQAQELIEHYAPWVALEAVDQQEEWVCLRGVKTA